MPDVIQDAVQPGAIFIKERTRLPEDFKIEYAPPELGWKMAKDIDGYALDRQIRAAGWTFFCLAGELKATVFGVTTDSSRRAAIKRILANPRSDEFNSLEITRIATKRFLVFSCTTVCTRPRHIQESMFLSRSEDVREWDRAKIARDLNESRSLLAIAKPAGKDTFVQPPVATTGNL
jgi:hypothetical protein